jgi:ABC-type branched-subunit amino acid transport system substrate-binding protein
MFNDGMVNLFEAGVITGRRKSAWPGKMVGAFALGTRKLYDFLDGNLAVELLRGAVTNDPYVIARNSRMVSVNTAIQVDLLGQVCSQSMGHRHYSGTGGQLDTHRGAQLSPGGRGIIALRATAREGRVSTILPVLDTGAGVTVPSQDVDTVVTEYGVAELRGRCVRDRARSLIRVAHPEFRGWLEQEVERLGIVPVLRVPGAQAGGVRAGSAAQPCPGVSAQTIRLGSFCDLSGPNALIGLSLYRGYSALYRHVNRWGGVHGRHLELIVEDVGYDPERAKAAARKLVESDEVFAVVSPLGTSTNLAVQQYLLERQVPVISPHSGASVWSTPVRPTYFALQPNYRVEGHILADYAVRHLGARRVAVAAVQDPFGQEGGEAAVERLRKLGLAPVAHVRLPLQEPRFTERLAGLREAEPELTILFTYPKQAAELLAEAREMGFRTRWLGSYVLSGPDMFVLAGPELVEGTKVACYPPGPRGHRGEQLFARLLRRDYGETAPGPHSRIGFAAAQLVVEGLRGAGPEPTRERLISALEGLKGWSGGLLPAVSYSSVDHRGLTTLAIHRAIRGRWLVEKVELSA